MKRLLLILTIAAFAALLALLIINWRVNSYSTGKLFRSTDDLPAENRVAIVLGARVGAGGVASNTLHDRVVTGVEIYKAGKTTKLLLSGGGEEPAVMKKLAIELGVPESDIVLDELGLRTYESCIRAKQVFQVEKAIIVTQDYHLPRSLYLCKNMGVDAIGVDAKRRDYDGERYAWVREYISRALAWYDINFRSFPTEPVDTQPIIP